MSWLDGFIHRVRTVLRPASYASELDEEMQHHLELDAMQQGDRDRARRAFGNRTAFQEETRQQTWLRWSDALRQDCGTAWRGLRRSRATTALAVATLALGIGANAATFTVIDRLFLRPPAGVEAPSELRRYWKQMFSSGAGPSFASLPQTFQMYRAIAEASGAPDQVFAYAPDFGNLRVGRSLEGQRVRGVWASANYFDVLGVRMALGRAPSADEDRMGNATPVIVVSHDFWVSHYGSASDVLGRSLQLGPQAYTVIGVTAPGFTGLDLQAVDVWVPLAASPAFYNQPSTAWTSFRFYGLQVVQRWRDDALLSTVEAGATQRIRAINSAQWRRPDTTTRVFVGPLKAGWQGTHVPIKLGQDLVIATRLAAVVAIVLLIAWANVINLLLAQATRRRREVAVRLALGMSHGRLMRCLGIESMMLAGLAAVGAGAIAWAGGNALRTLLLPDVAWRDDAFDWRVAAFTMVVALLSGVLAAVVPASQVRRHGVHHAIKAGTGTAIQRRSRLRSGLVLTQAALSVVLLVGAALFLRSLRNVEALDIGYDADRLLFGYAQFEEGQSPPHAVAAATARDVAVRLSEYPGVLGVARTNFEPMRGVGFTKFYTERDSAGSFGGHEPTYAQVSPSFFETVGLSLRAGRTFSGGDADGVPPEVIVNDAMARMAWPDRSAIGQCMRFIARTNHCYTVVGVVETGRRGSLIEPEARAMFYVPLGNVPEVEGPGRVIVVRTDARAMVAASSALEAEMRRAWPTGLPTIRRMTTNLEPEYRPWRLGVTLFGSLGVLAFVVALIGVYGTVAYTVGERTRESGVRMALGAAVPTLLRQVLGEELRVIGLGVAVGIGLALAGGRLLAALLYGVTP
ncbi:MAG: ABC transporter permease [Cytophagaceae bacterium]|nr:ABC transporter permease [Gemmatimonadaceae bacterium]